MEFTVLSNKRTLDGFVDLQDSTWSNQIQMNLLDTFRVTSDFAMRWDKIADKYYGEPDLGDALFKFNEHDNPFGVMEGDIVLIPVKDDLKKGYTKDQNINIFDSPKPLQTTFDSPTIDPARNSFLTKKKLLPPTFSKGTQKKYNDDGTITLAE